MKHIKWQKLKLDLELSILLISLLGIGTSFVFSASSVMAAKHYDDSMYFFNRQLLYLFLGTVAMLVMSKIRYQSLRGYIPLLNVVTLILMALVYVPAFNVSVNGATRWISIFGLTFQPSELAKITMILTLSHMIDMKRRAGKLGSFTEGLLPILMYSGMMVGIVLMQKHLSASGVLLFITMSLILLGGIKKIYLLIMGGSVLGVAIIGIIMEPFRMVRIFSFLDPYKDKLGDGFHVLQSWYALSGGGLFGLGLGMSRQKFEWLPENHTDFILAVIGEEIGFVGIGLVLFLFLWFLLRALNISLTAPDYFGMSVAFGITSMLFFQVMINVSVVSGMFPVTGMPLPFVSYGGTATIMLLGSVGVLFNIASQRKNALQAKKEQEEINQKTTVEEQGFPEVVLK